MGLKWRGGGGAAWLDDMYVYDPAAMSWERLFTGNAPSARYGLGFTFSLGRLWAQGGYGFIASTGGTGVHNY